jgi:hypothetical protein
MAASSSATTTRGEFIWAMPGRVTAYDGEAHGTNRSERRTADVFGSRH